MHCVSIVCKAWADTLTGHDKVCTTRVESSGHLASYNGCNTGRSALPDIYA